MYEVTHQLNQLPNAVRSEMTAHAGHTDGMAPLQLVTHHRAIAHNIIAQKRARFEPLPPHDEMASLISDMLQGNDLSFLSGAAHQPFPRWVTHEIVKSLQDFINNLAPLQSKLEQESHQRAAHAAQMAQRQAEEAARQLAQRQVQEAARLHAQRMAEEAARQLVQRQAEEAAQLAARQLAQQQAETAARALARHRAEEAALEEMRLALELKPASGSLAVQAPAVISKESPPKTSDAHPAKEIVFIPGPTAMAEIERATLVLKHSIDAAVVQYASAIGPYLNTSPVPAATAR
jgi:flagellar biosynthesis GTPase FlhF